MARGSVIMRNLGWWVGVAVFGAGTLAVGWAGVAIDGQQAPVTQPVTNASPTALIELESLGWLAGTWEGPYRDGTWEAVYSSPAGGEIVSANKEMAGGCVRMFEFERFRVVGADVVMTPYPFGRPMGDFRLREHERPARRAVFENPENDFPREIHYARPADDTLTIELVGERSGEPVRLGMTLKKRRP